MGSVETVSVAWAEECCKVARIEWEKRAQFVAVLLTGVDVAKYLSELDTPIHEAIIIS